MRTGVLHNMSIPPRTTVTAVQRAVHGPPTLFSLGLCALANGVFGRVPATANWEEYLERALELSLRKWEHDPSRMLAELDDPSVPSPQGSLIGWTVKLPTLSDDSCFQLCVDPALTIRVLSRRIGDLYISTREPRLEWEQLCSPGMFVLDHPGFDGVLLSDLRQWAARRKP